MLNIRRLVTAALALSLFAVASASQAGYVYTFSFDATEAFGQSYAADSYSFETDSILTGFGSVAPTTADSLNNFQPSTLSYVVSSAFTNSLFESSIDWSLPLYQVNSFRFNLFGPTPLTVGSYTTDLGQRGVKTYESGGFAVTNFVNTAATLTISESRSVPEPGTMSMFGAGLIALAWTARRRKTHGAVAV
jgi:hypothetical protein